MGKIPPELQLLLACAKAEISRQDEAAIREILAYDIDWTLFARNALDQGLAGIAGRALANVAADLTPREILGALQSILDQTRSLNLALFNELAALMDALASSGIDAVPLRGPVLALQAYGDIGLRRFKDLDLLVRDADRIQALATLRQRGYGQQTTLTASQLELIQRAQGREVLFSESRDIALKLHTRVIDASMTLDLDYDTLWERASRTLLQGRSILTFAPEDSIILLAIHGGKELWWNLRWLCDMAAFLRRQTDLDWDLLISRSRAQGCLRMVLLALLLARRAFVLSLPEVVAAAEHAHPELRRLADGIIDNWLSGAKAPPGHGTLSMARLRLHDGIGRQARHAARSLFLPGPQHIASVRLPGAAAFAYIPIKLVQDILLTPLRTRHGRSLPQTGQLQDLLAASALPLFMIPATAAKRATIRQLRDARADAKRAIAANRVDGAAWASLGDALAGLKRFKQAIACYDKALSLAPYNTSVWKRRSAAAQAVGKQEDPLDSPRDPQDADAWTVLAGRLFSTKRFAEAAEASARALAIDPTNIAAARVGIQSRLFACDWRRREEDSRQVSASVQAGRSMTSPFFHRALSDSEAESLLIARLNTKGFPRTEPLWRGERYRHGKIRVAYVSTDLRDHVVADAIAGCFEHHDKARFETYAISLGPNDRSAMRRRIEAAFDRFIDAQSMSDSRIAGLMRELEIDIVVDLNGNSGETRTAILARRPAPVQAHYLGFAGTMGASFMDYVIADRIVIPEAHRVHYAEKVVYLPHTYMPNDAKREIARTPSRSEAGLPERGFVFACHNQEYKLGPEIFDVWMRLLKAIEGSVLWLKFHNPSAMANLWQEANARGVASERLIFAPRLPRAEDHLARLRLADLFLDTRPYNAHATACDALWAGLPVLTCPGDTFPARVAASVLHAIGLPELVTPTLVEYEQMALLLARDPDRLSSVRSKLARNRDNSPLFDTAGITRDLESAYSTMWERQQNGLPPEGFAVQRPA